MTSKIKITIGSKTSNNKKTVDIAVKNKPTKSEPIENKTQITHKTIKQNRSAECIKIIDTFNLVLIKMVDHLDKYYGDTHMSLIRIILKKMINETPEETISLFLLNVYKNDRYRKNILNQNDAFFLNEIDTVSEDGSADSETITKLFIFKDKWDMFGIDTKAFIKKTFLVLIKICSKYIFLL